MSLKIACSAMAIVFVSAVTFAVEPQTWYVDNKLAEYEGHDGSSWTKAYKVIQDAVTAAASGDTILVAPGTYGDEQGSRTSTIAARVVIPADKALTIKSTGGKEVTHIVGTFGTTKVFAGEDEGYGSGAIGGIVIAYDSAQNVSKGSRIEGFTIRRVAPSDSGKRGGGVAYLPDPGNNKDIANLPWVVDCVVSNCAVNGSGILGNVNCARVWVYRPTSSGNNGTVCAYNCNAIHSVFVGGRNSNNTAIGVAYGRFVNCTFFDFGNRATSSNGPKLIANCIDESGGGRLDVSDRSSQAANSVVAATSIQESRCVGVDMVWGKTGGQMMAPTLCDYRPVKTNPYLSSTAVTPAAADAGAEKWLNEFPDEFRYVDFYGKRFTATDGKICAGASQEAVTPKCGFNHARGLIVEGHETIVKDRSRYAFFDRYPVLLHLTPDYSLVPKLFCYRYGGDNDYWRYKFPTKGDMALFVLREDVLWDLNCYDAKDEFYVDKVKGSVVASTTGTKDDPFKTLQQAVDAASTADGVATVVHVAKGVYDEGGAMFGELFSRVSITSTRKIRFIADEGPEETIIKGEADSEAPAESYGCGPNAVRCIGASNTTTIFDGFSLIDGHTNTNSTKATGRNGGALYADGKAVALVNCIVSNNYANAGSAMISGSAYGCRFYDNPVLGSGQFQNDPVLAFCEIGPQRVLTGKDNACFFSDNCVLAHLTICNTNRNMTILSAHGRLFNSIIDHSRYNSNNAGQKRILGNVFWDFSYNSNTANGLVNTNGIHYVKADPLFVDDAGRDWRLMADSPAFGYGKAWGGLDENDVSFENQFKFYYCAMAHDPCGNEPYFVNGLPTAGAYQRPGKIKLATAPKGSTLAGPNGETAVEFDEETTVTLTGTKRQVVGLRVNGEATTETSVTIVPAELVDASGVLPIEPIVSTNWYVDADNGNDSANGWAESTAKKTLVGVMECVDAGDLVTALPGTYDEGEMLPANHIDGNSQELLLKSRVVIPRGVSLVSRDGQETTIIKGKYLPTGHFGYLGGDDEIDKGTLLRCVTMYPDTELRGFTLFEGGTFSNGCMRAKGSDNICGGGVLALEVRDVENPSIFVRDCYFLNCGAVRGGGMMYGTAVNCRFNGTMGAGGTGGATYKSTAMIGCLLDEIRCATSVDEPRYCLNVTFGKNNHTAGGNGQEGTGVLRMGSYGLAENCLFLGGTKNIPAYNLRNCVVPSDDYLEAAQEGWIREGIVVAQVTVDANYMPARDSDAVDAFALDAVPEQLGAFDLHGNPRVLNAALDIGAVEYDWRADYAAAISANARSSVSAASPAVQLTTDGVAIPDGTLVFNRTNRMEGRNSLGKFVFEVTGNGTLTLTVDGVEVGSWTQADGEVSRQFGYLTAAQNDFAFTYEPGAGDTGAAYVKSFASCNGMAILVR